jgi:tetratricopeptide (TPR) repeat protein
MNSLRMVGLIVAVFLLSLPVAFLVRADPSGWQFFSDAKEEAEEKEERDDPVVDILCIKAMKEMSDGNYTKAIATYTKAIERDPKYSFSYIGRGDAYALRGDLDRAMQDYHQAARLDPGNSAARDRLEIARMEKEEK